jgi:hypothetical protein
MEFFDEKTRGKKSFDSFHLTMPLTVNPVSGIRIGPLDTGVLVYSVGQYHGFRIL